MAPARTARLRRPVAAFRDLRTSAKPLVCFLLVCALVVGVGVFGLSSLAESEARTDGLDADELLPILQLGEIDADLQQAQPQILQLSGVATAAQETTEGANSTSRAADDLSRMASDLTEIVAQFRY